MMILNNSIKCEYVWAQKKSPLHVRMYGGGSWGIDLAAPDLILAAHQDTLTDSNRLCTMFHVKQPDDEPDEDEHERWEGGGTARLVTPVAIFGRRNFGSLSDKGQITEVREVDETGVPNTGNQGPAVAWVSS